MERAWLLLEFACALERGLAVACEGCAAAPQLGPSVAAFFCVPKNQKVPYGSFCFPCELCCLTQEVGQRSSLPYKIIVVTLLLR